MPGSGPSRDASRTVDGAAENQGPWGYDEGMRTAAVRPSASEEPGSRSGVDRARWLQWVLDAGIALLILPLPYVPPFLDAGEPIAVVPTLLVSIVVAVALLFRRRYPLIVLGAVLSMSIPTLLAGAHTVPVTAGAAVALYTVASERSRRTTLIATGIALVSVVGLIAGSTDEIEGVRTGISVMVWVALAGAIGDGVRSRRTHVQLLQDRARRAEETREQVARARVAEERLRIARELHDIVAHHIAVVNIQAGLASRAMSKQAFGTAATAVDRVSEAARSALDDLSAVLRLLRATEESDQRSPAPGMAQVNDLIQTYSSGDDRVQWTIRGEPVPLDTGSELAAYRVIQEALTNATKHGAPGSTRLTLSYETDGLAVTVSNLIRTDVGDHRPAAPGTGYGVIGLHERVGSVGGQIAVSSQPDGRFVLRALIPYTPAKIAGTEQIA